MILDKTVYLAISEKLIKQICQAIETVTNTPQQAGAAATPRHASGHPEATTPPHFPPSLYAAHPHAMPPRLPQPLHPAHTGLMPPRSRSWSAGIFPPNGATQPDASQYSHTNPQL